MASGSWVPVSRRQFLLGSGAAASAVLLGACGSDGSSAAPVAGDLALAQFFGGLPMLAAGAEVRAPFGVADAEGLLSVADTPRALTVSIHGPGGDTVVEGIDVARHAEDLPRAYFPLRFTVDKPGVYAARTEVDGQQLEMAVKVDAASDVAVIKVGDRLPAMVTPTPDAPHGVEPICTSVPPCSLHEVTVADALDEGRPLALLVATPAFCQFAICAPVLEVLLAQVDARPGWRFLHAEVYMDPAANLDDKAPVVNDLGLAFEPCLVVADAGGTVVARLDTIYDSVELDDVLTRLT